MQLNAKLKYTFVSIPDPKQSLRIQYLECDDDNNALYEYNDELNRYGSVANR